LVEAHDVDVWFLLLFFPLVPLSRWRVSVASAGTEHAADALELTLHSRSRVPLRVALRRIAKAVGVTVMTCLPLTFAVWKVGSPWATPVLTLLLGSVLGPGLLGEMGVLLAGAATPILVLMHLDEHTPRVSLGSALRAR
jgi:hypothetical protein